MLLRYGLGEGAAADRVEGFASRFRLGPVAGSHRVEHVDDGGGVATDGHAELVLDSDDDGHGRAGASGSAANSC